QVPAQQPLGDAKCRGEAEEAVEYVLAGAWCDARVGEQPLQLARSGPIETELHARRNTARQETCTQRQLHVQQHVEAASAERCAQRRSCREAGALVDGDNLPPLEESHETRLGPADDPGQLCCWPCLL